MQPVRIQSSSRMTVLAAMLIAAGAGVAACGSSGQGDGSGSSEQAATVAPVSSPSGSNAQQLAHGANVWLKATFGGEQFFTLLLPQALGLNVGLSQVLLTPRSERFSAVGRRQRSELHGQPDAGSARHLPSRRFRERSGCAVRGRTHRCRRRPAVPEPAVQRGRARERDKLAHPRRRRLRGLSRGARARRIRQPIPTTRPGPTSRSPRATSTSRSARSSRRTCRRPIRAGRCSTRGRRGPSTRRPSRATASTTPGSSPSSSTSRTGRTSACTRTACC